MERRSVLKGVTLGAVAFAVLAGASYAQDVTLRMHQFLPPQATLPAQILDPWARSVEEASDGRIKIEHFYAMSLGGRPPELMDQARDGVVDIIMTLPGYTPGRFPSTEVFELPFMMTDPVATAKAYWEVMETELQDGEFSDVHVLGAWVHGPGMIHSKETIAALEDMNGKTLRGPTRVINDLLSELGAEPVGMPVPAIPEALSKGVIGGTVIPWEVTTALRLPELVESHTEFSGDEALYTATFVLAMNKAKYDAMPEDLRAILDAESGEKFSAFASGIMLEMDAPARAKAEEAGNTIVTLDEAEVARWKDAAQPVIERWTAEMDAAGKDGAAMIEKAKALIEKHGG
ncbi:MAG: TRAP transporter substrate-binding protein [Pseudomonadota bacterium]